MIPPSFLLSRQPSVMFVTFAGALAIATGLYYSGYECAEPTSELLGFLPRDPVSQVKAVSRYRAAQSTSTTALHQEDLASNTGTY